MGLTLVSKYWWQFSTSILLMITTLSLIPLPALPDVPGSDKTHHYLAYASLMFPVAIKRPKYWLWIGSFFVIWSGAIELLQPFVNRYAEWLDLLANVIGILIGILLASILRILVSYNND